MLQVDKSRIDTGQRLSSALSGADVLEIYTSFTRRQFPTILVCLLLAIVLGIIYIATARPSFTAQAQMIIDTRKVQVFQQQSVLGESPVDTAGVESQVEILKSENIALSVIKNFNLTEDSEFVGTGGGLVGALLELMGSSTNPDSQTDLLRRAVQAYQDRLSVKRMGLSYVIQINFRSFDGDRAAQIANGVADAYILDQLDAKYEATRRASTWLQDRIAELREQVSTAERAVVDFKTKNNIVSTGGNDKRLVGQQQVAELNSQLVVARAATAEAQARLDRIETVLRLDPVDASADATVTDTLKSEIVTKLRSRYLDLAAREADWSTRYGREHMAAINLRNQMRETRNSIFEELKRLGETYKSDYEIAKQRETGVQRELDLAVSQSQTTDSAQIALRELESTAQTYKTLYDNFLQRYMESVQQQSFPITEARLISKATKPLRKSHPQVSLVIGIACFGGLLFGVGLGWLKDMSDRVFRTEDQIRDILKKDCLALVPFVERERGTLAKALTSSSAVLQKNRPRTIERGENEVLWAALDEPFSRFAEGMRSIKLAIDLNSAGKSHTVIGFTSSLPNEGKSTVAAAFAQLMAQNGARCILVDCDLRNPSLSSLLATGATAGLIEVLTGKVGLDEVVWTDPSTRLSFLPAVVKHSLANSSEILASESAKQLFSKLRAEYDYVIADFSPIAPIVDVRATSHLVDSYIFVIEWGNTKIDVVEHALESSSEIYENTLGVVLNKVDMKKFARYGQQTSYYYNKHYGRYGQSG
jgi:polysaccharide biosynthesis transport protein